MIVSVFWKILILVLNLRLGSAVIYKINSSEYEKFPPVFHLEPYEKCMENPDAVYCVTEVALVSDSPNQLLDTIREYSALTTKHFNHSLSRYGICLNSCKYAQNTTRDRRHTLEACLNETYWHKYGLKTKLQDYVRCNGAQRQIDFEAIDIIFLVVCAVILLLTFIGTFCDFYFMIQSKGFGMRCLTVFSIRKNWKRLTASAAEGPEPRLRKLNFIACLKVVSMILIISAHNLISVVFYVDNPNVIEDYYNYTIAHLFLNGPIVVQMFFIITGFLLIYNMLLLSEKHKIDWSILPKGIFLRWIRLTPPYALLMFFAVTWMRYVGSGPAWDIAVIDEVNDCKKYWWQYMLYINNYNDASQCFLQTWYLAADTQLYCLGLIVFIGCRRSFSRKVVLSFLLLLGFIIPPLQTYLEDLDGVVVVSPESIIHFFRDNPTYIHFNTSTHCNIFPYVLGLIAGYLVYHLQKINFDIQIYKKNYRFIFWCLFPLGTAIVWSGCIFYQDIPRPSMVLRLAYATFMKPVYAILLCIGIISILFKFEKIVNFVLESQVWTVLARLSYCAYLVHVTLLRITMGTRTVETHATVHLLLMQALYLVTISFAAALPLVLLVEQPFSQLAKVLFM